MLEVIKDRAVRAQREFLDMTEEYVIHYYLQAIKECEKEEEEK